MNKLKSSKIILFGDNIGIRELLLHISPSRIVGIVASATRPQYLDEIKMMADEIDTKFIIQPKYSSSKYLHFGKIISDLAPDMILCYSYSLIIRNDILEIVDYNAINIHESLLPKNRGPNPENWTIIKGEKKTGVTIHFMDEGLDSGDIIAQKEVEIDFKDTWKILLGKLFTKRTELLNEIIPQLLKGNVERKSQNEKIATKNFRLTEKYPEINFNTMTDLKVYNLIRGQVKPLKGAYLMVDNEKIFFDEFIEYDEIKNLREEYGR